MTDSCHQPVDGYAHPISIGVVGAGAWGTALAVVAARAGRHVDLWGRTPNDLISLAKTGENHRYLPGIKISPLPHVTADLSVALKNDVILLAVPAQQIRSIATLINACGVNSSQTLVICAKGVEQTTGMLMSEVLSELIPNISLAALSGPTFATEIAKGLPAAVTIAANDVVQAAKIAEALSSATFRCYGSDDLIGVELCGAVKNVLAIACGIVDGKGYGENARAALITRGLVELRRLCLALGGKAETPAGLAGLGDMTLTCTSLQSRNYALGYALGRQETPHHEKLTEGVFSATAVLKRAAQAGCEMPICAAVEAVVHHKQPLEQVVTSLLTRPLKMEIH